MLEKLYIFSTDRYNYYYMRNFILSSVLFSVCAFVLLIFAQTSPASSQDRVIQPFNLNAILKGKKSSGLKTSKSKEDILMSRNPVEILREGRQLPITEALSESADYSPLRDRLRRVSLYEGLSAEEAQLVLAEVEAQAQANQEKQWQRRNEFYIRSGMSDEFTREFLSSKQGRLTKRAIRNEKREQKKQEAAEQKQKTLAQQQRNTPNYKPYTGDEDEDGEPPRTSRVISPTAKPGSDGTIKPFFYR